MAVTITHTTGATAHITWTRTDDPHGYIAHAIETDQLAYALEALGDAAYERTNEAALEAARHTTQLARRLEQQAAKQVVALRNDHGLSWRRIAEVVHGDPDRQSTVRRQYEAGCRQLGI